jgi:hypothetical protein
MYGARIQLGIRKQDAMPGRVCSVWRGTAAKFFFPGYFAEQEMQKKIQDFQIIPGD